MLNERGHEVPDPSPMVRPLNLHAQETLAEKIKRMVRYELSQAAADQGHETFEESDDFDVDDDPELKSPYELDETATFERQRDGPQQTAGPNGPDRSSAPGVQQSGSVGNAAAAAVPAMANGSAGAQPAGVSQVAGPTSA